MKTSCFSGVYAVLLLFLVAGCDAVTDHINENVPEIGIAGGIMGLNGEEGADLAGSFAADAGKTGAGSSIATFSVHETFSDYGATDFKVTEITSGFALSDLTVTREGNSLPETIMMQGFSFGGTIADADGTFTFEGLDAPDVGMGGGNLGFNRLNCETTGESITCNYVACVFLSAGPSCYSVSRSTAVVFAERVRVLSQIGRPAAVSEATSTERLLKVITEQDGVDTPNTSNLVFSFRTPTPAEELAGATVRLRMHEVNSKIKSEIL